MSHIVHIRLIRIGISFVQRDVEKLILSAQELMCSFQSASRPVKSPMRSSQESPNSAAKRTVISVKTSNGQRKNHTDERKISPGTKTSERSSTDFGKSSATSSSPKALARTDSQSETVRRDEQSVDGRERRTKAKGSEREGRLGLQMVSYNPEGSQNEIEWTCESPKRNIKVKINCSSPGKSSNSRKYEASAALHQNHDHNEEASDSMQNQDIKDKEANDTDSGIKSDDSATEELYEDKDDSSDEPQHNLQEQCHPSREMVKRGTFVKGSAVNPPEDSADDADTHDQPAKKISQVWIIVD